jgi:TPR repeat protein
MYIQGEGVARDEAEALAWFEVAARAGMAEAAGHRDYVKARAAAVTIMAAEQRVRAIEELVAIRRPVK